MENNKTNFLIVARDHIHSLEENANMRACLSLSIVLSFLSVSLFSMSGCKYNVSSPMYSKPSPYNVTPSITSVDPASEAKGGVNTITIFGHNLVIASTDTLTPSNTIVYFNNTLQGEVVSADSTSIVVRRPNISGDSIEIKVAPHNAIVEPTYSPYRIDPVIEQYGGFLQNLALGAIALSGDSGLYVVETVSKSVDEVTSPIDNVVLGGSDKATQAPTGACVGTDGNLYILQNGRFIDKVDLVAGTITQKWVTLPSGKVVKFGDCGPGGYLFLGGSNTDLCVVSLNVSGSLAASQITPGGGYASEQILAIKIYNGYVYVASRTSSTSPAIIWRNQIIADSTVGSREEVLDMSATAYVSDLVTGIAFSSSGTMYLSTASADPILVVDPATGKVDDFYLGIVPPYCDAMVWSKTSNYLYLISGYTLSGTVVQTWTVYRLDMGTTGGANF